MKHAEFWKGMLADVAKFMVALPAVVLFLTGVRISLGDPMITLEGVKFCFDWLFQWLLLAAVVYGGSLLISPSRRTVGKRLAHVEEDV